MTSSTECEQSVRLPAIPCVDDLFAARSRLHASFHALPLSMGRSIERSALRPAYDRLLGSALDSDLTIGSPDLDSFFFARNGLARAEALCARAFGARSTLFVTCGTTIANRIVLDALTSEGMRVLVDKGVHQSIHFGLSDLRARREYLEPRVFCDVSERAAWSLAELRARLEEAEAQDDPFEMLVVNAHTYDGVVYDLARVFDVVAKVAPRMRQVFVDEAWSAATCFDAGLRRGTAMVAADAVDVPFAVVSTQSAHKSISALRQASLIHVRGDEDFAEILRVARYRTHTTSPSYLIAASLDLARAQMEMEGSQLTARGRCLADRLVAAITTEPALQSFSAIRDRPEGHEFSHLLVDPTKVSVDISALGMTGGAIRLQLLREHGLFISRCTERSLLVNIHIGIREEDVDRLAEALAALTAHSPRRRPCMGEISSSYVIPYPPGVPLVVPGEIYGSGIDVKVRAAERAGARIFTIHG